MPLSCTYIVKFIIVLSTEQAKFQLKGSYDPSLKKRKRPNKKKKKGNPQER